MDPMQVEATEPTQRPWYVVTDVPDTGDFGPYLENLSISRYEDDSTDAICWMGSGRADAELIVKAVNNYDALVKALKPFAAMARPGFETDPQELVAKRGVGCDATYIFERDILAARAVLEKLK